MILKNEKVDYCLPVPPRNSFTPMNSPEASFGGRKISSCTPAGLAAYFKNQNENQIESVIMQLREIPHFNLDD